MKQSQTQALIPKKAQFIFDTDQAYAAYSQAKIQYQQHNPFFQLPPTKNTKIASKKIILLPALQSTNRIQSQSQSDTRLKDWNVNYLEDIAKRVLCKQIHAESNSDYLEKMRLMQKDPPKKKSRRHKTKFKIPKTLKNQQVMQNIVCQFINDNKKLVNEEVIHIKEYEKTAPFFLETVDFAERLIAEKTQFKEKYGFDERNLRKNNLVLEEVILKRMQKRENQQSKTRALLTQPPQTQIIQDKLDQDMEITVKTFEITKLHTNEKLQN